MLVGAGLVARRIPWAGFQWPTIPATVLGWFAVLLGMTLMLRPPLDPDLGWHLRTGQLILATHQIPHADIYSYTAHGAPWVDQEWLWEAVMASVYAVAGVPGVVLMGSLIVGMSIALVWAILRLRGTSAVLAGGGALISLLNLTPVAHVRPALMSALFTAAFLCVGELYRRRSDWRWLLALLPCQLLWANMHASYILGPALCATFCIAYAWKSAGNGTGILGRISKQALTHWGAACAALLAVSLINPNGAGLLRFTFAASRIPFNREYIHEWQGPNFQTIAAAPLLVTLLLALLLLLLAPTRRPGGAAAILLVAGTLGVLQTQQLYPFYAVACAPVIAQMLDFTVGRHMPRRLSLLTGFTLIGSLLAIVVRLPLASLTGSGYQAALAEEYPVAAASFIKQHQLPGPLWNEFDWGGYLVQNLPRLPVFVDGRSEVYGDAFLHRYIDVAQGTIPLDSLFDQYAIRLALTEPFAPLAAELRQRADWKDVYEDSISVVFVRRSLDERGWPLTTANRPQAS